MLPPWLTVVLFFLAVHRVTRFIGQDTFPPVAWVRTRLVQGKLREPSRPVHWLVYLIGDNVNSGCPWCISIYVGALGSLGLGLFDGRWPWWSYVALWLASSTVTGMLAQLED